MGRKRREKDLPQEVVRMLESAIGVREREPNLPPDRVRKFLMRMAADIAHLAALPDSSLTSTYEYAAMVLANEMKEALGEDMTCRIFTALGKPRGKPEEKSERQRWLIGVTLGRTLGSVVEWLAANPEKAEWFGLSTKDEETIKQHVLRLREKVEKEMDDLRRIDAADYYSEFFPKR
jgi:hypothetical protein